MGSFIREKLWLGGVEDAYDEKRLKAQGTTHILTVECSALREQHRAGFTVHFVDAEDSAEEDLLHHFDDCFHFIESARGDDNGGVLVHCFMGYSRSSTIVLSYLMRKEGLSLKDATENVMKLRNIGPNPGFLHQLRLFEKMGNRIVQSHPDYRAFALDKLTAKVRQASFGRKQIKAFKDDSELNGAAMDRALALDPALVNAAAGNKDDESSKLSSQKPKLLFRCRKCRRPLATSSSLLPHPPGRGKVFGTNSLVINRSLDAIRGRGKGGRGVRGRIEEEEDDSDPVCHEGLFFEPVQWMKDQILFLEGQLTCPKPQCSAKLGHFNWVGQPCPCGFWVVPAFHMAANKVDKCQVETSNPGVKGGGIIYAAGVTNGTTFAVGAKEDEKTESVKTDSGELKDAAANEGISSRDASKSDFEGNHFDNGATDSAVTSSSSSISSVPELEKQCAKVTIS